MESTIPDDRAGVVRDGVDWLAAGFERRVQIDLRALAAFRIAIGSLIVFDLALRARNFTAFYTDDGVLPTEALYSDYSEVHSIHAWLGDAWLTALLFVVAAAFAVAMILGYRTKTVTLVSWLLLFSLHNRNPMVLNGGDVLFRMLVFWSIFLPLGERWSIDARGLDRGRTTTASIATVAVLVQVAIMYVSNFVHKTRGDPWLEGDAVPYILTLDQFTVLLGPHLAAYPDLLTGFTYLWLFLMALAPFLFLLTGWPRAILATAFAGMHVGMAVTLQIGVFPLVVVAGLLLFYPPEVWGFATSIADRGGITERIADLRGRIEASLPVTVRGAGWRARLVHEIPIVRVMLTVVIPGVFIALIVSSNAHALGYTSEPIEPGQELLDKTDTEQTWRLFAPNPLDDTRWFVAESTLENGEKVDAFTGGEVTFDRPPDPAERVGSARWRKYLSNVYGSSNENHQSYLANYLCGKLERTQDSSPETVEIHALQQEGTPFGGESDVRRTRLVAYDCSGPLVQP